MIKIAGAEDLQYHNGAGDTGALIRGAAIHYTQSGRTAGTGHIEGARDSLWRPVGAEEVLRAEDDGTLRPGLAHTFL